MIRNYTSVLLPHIRHNPNITSLEKLLVSHIDVISNIDGQCEITNTQFAQMYQIANRTVSRAIGNLVKHGLIVCVEGNNRNRQISTTEAYHGH